MSIEATLANLQIMASYLDLSRLHELIAVARSSRPAFDSKRSVSVVDHPDYPSAAGLIGFAAADTNARVCLHFRGWTF